MSEANNARTTRFSKPEKGPLRGSLERVDPDTGSTRTIFAQCQLTRCSLMQRLCAETETKKLETSPVTECRINGNVHDIITMSGTFYRFTLEAQQTKLPVPSTKHLRQKITKLARLLRFRR